MHFAHEAVLDAHSSVTGHDHFMPAAKLKLVTDQDFLPTLLKLLSGAKKSVDLMSFSFAIGSAAGKISEKGAPYTIAKKLVELSERGIKVRLFTEGLRETVDRNRVTADFLEEGGVEVKYGSTHAKGFCIDKEIVFFGSTNLSQQSITKNYEANIIMKGKEYADGFLRYFDYHWKGGHHGGIKLKAPWFPDGTFKNELVELIDSAKKTIHFSIYFFDHKDIEKALIRAQERGVHITGHIHRHMSFALSYIYRNQATVKRMRSAGMEDLHWGIPWTFSHAKYLVVDGKDFMIGTGNWLVEDVVIHPQLYVHLSDKAIAKKLIAHLDKEIEEAEESHRLRRSS
ncbi:MAG: phospholipase D-like domain-containing protein [Bacteriovoracaceae bacterium]